MQQEIHYQGKMYVTHLPAQSAVYEGRKEEEEEDEEEEEEEEEGKKQSKSASSRKQWYGVHYTCKQLVLVIN